MLFHWLTTQLMKEEVSLETSKSHSSCFLHIFPLLIYTSSDSIYVTFSLKNITLKRIYKSFFKMCIVLYAASTNQDVEQIEQELQDEETAKEHLAEIEDIYSVFGNLVVRTEQYNIMLYQRGQFTIRSQNSVAPGRMRSNRSIARQKETTRIFGKTKPKFGYVWESKKRCSHVDEERVQCTNLAHSGGLCRRHAGKLCSHVDEEGVQCTKTARIEVSVIVMREISAAMLMKRESSALT